MSMLAKKFICISKKFNSIKGVENMKKIYIWGYWTKNFGDDLFLAILKSKLKNNVDLILNAEKKYASYYEKLGYKVIVKDSIVNRIYTKISNVFNIAEPYYRKVNKNSIFLLLGGSLFAENKSKKSEAMQLINLSHAIRRAGASYIVGSNFGPYYSTKFFNEYHNLFKQVNDICFRDLWSYELFKKDLPNVRYSIDLALEGKWEEYCDEMVPRYDIVISAIDLSKRKNLQEYCECYERNLIDICNYYNTKGKSVALVEFCEKEGDVNVYSRMLEKMQGKNVSIISYDSINTILSVIKGCDKIFATRFHAIMMGIYFKKNIVPIIYDQKSTNALHAYAEKYTSYDICNVNEWNIEMMVNSNQVISLRNVKSSQLSRLKNDIF